MQEIELAEKIKISIADSSVPLWFPNLTAHLAETGWWSLKNEFGLTSANYGTARILTGSIDVPLSVIPFEDKSGNTPFALEFLSKELTENYLDAQIDFYSAAELAEQPVLDCVAEAIELIKKVPGLYESVLTLVKSIHLVKLEDDNYDVSFSEPHIPFSIFVSVPKTRIKVDFLRVAEAIVHEAMHLQLSLIEKVVSLFCEDEQKFYSPWKNEYRHSNGIIHALYVFKVIDSFYKQIAQFLPAKKYSVYLVNRKNLISQQVTSVSKIDLFQALTEFGKVLVDRLVTDQI